MNWAHTTITLFLTLCTLTSQLFAQVQEYPGEPELVPAIFANQDAWDIVFPYFFPTEVQQNPDLAHQLNLILDWHPLGGTPSEPGSDYIGGTFVLSSSNGQHSGTDFELDAIRTFDIPLTQDMIDAGVEAFTFVAGQIIHSNPLLDLDMLVVGNAVTYSQGETRFLVGACFNNSTSGRAAQTEVLHMLWGLRTLPVIACSVQTIALTNCEQNMNNEADACVNQNLIDLAAAMAGCGGVAYFACPACVATPPPATILPCAFCITSLGCIGLATKDALSDMFAISIRRNTSLNCCCLYAETIHSGGTWMNPTCSFVCP